MARDTARLAIGIPSYTTYVAHMQAKHPDRAPMTPAEFFRERQAARYSGGSGRCC
jgi:uncharacterized short protein YbdD (DUF466 family)